MPGDPTAGPGEVPPGASSAGKSPGYRPALPCGRRAPAPGGGVWGHTHSVLLPPTPLTPCLCSPLGKTGAGSHRGRVLPQPPATLRPASPAVDPGKPVLSPGFGAQNVPGTFAHRLRWATGTGPGPGRFSPEKSGGTAGGWTGSPCTTRHPPGVRVEPPGGRSPGGARAPRSFTKTALWFPTGESRYRELPDRPSRVKEVREEAPPDSVRSPARRYGTVSVAFPGMRNGEGGSPGSPAAAAALGGRGNGAEGAGGGGAGHGGGWGAPSSRGAARRAGEDE